MLIIVGRQDTVELEAQIRGSRHAWDVRLISAEALIKLVLLKENTDAAETGLKIQSLLTPVEYTRLDRMVDVMFTTVTDVEVTPETADDVTINAVAGDLVEPASAAAKGVWQFTDSQVLQAKREVIVSSVGAREETHLLRKSRALYWNAARDVRLACAMSKRYLGKNQNPYWYAYHPQWDAFLAEARRSSFVLGCMDMEAAFAITHDVLKPLLPYLNTTTKGISRIGTSIWPSGQVA